VRLEGGSLRIGALKTSEEATEVTGCEVDEGRVKERDCPGGDGEKSEELKVLEGPPARLDDRRVWDDSGRALIFRSSF